MMRTFEGMYSAASRPWYWERSWIDVCKKADPSYEWADIGQDLKALQGIEIEDNGKAVTLRL